MMSLQNSFTSQVLEQFPPNSKALKRGNQRTCLNVLVVVEVLHNHGVTGATSCL
uniref:Uncharacterized protein n=1 Tax=Anguilla anguilla TaxID=7936 RepID=A0A0E9UX56_ANGAN